MTEKIVVGGSSVTAGQLEDFFRQIKDGSIGGEQVQAVLEHRNPWPKRWIEKDGVIYFTVVSNGKSGEEWINHFEGRGQSVGSYAKSVLQHKGFRPTKAGTVHHVAVLKGDFYSDDGRITKLIRADAKKRKMIDPHAEVACLIRDNFTDKEIEEMGLNYIITMHEPIPDSDGVPSVLGSNRCARYRLGACLAHPDNGWGRGAGFAFAVAQGIQH